MARIFSGMAPSGFPTLGNYLGANRNWVKLQTQGDCLYCIVDQHAITNFQDPATLRENTRVMAALLVAMGIDTQKHILFHQSAVPAHARLAWLFNCVARIGWLNRMTQFKDKAGKNREAVSTGLYVYPNLMAADIHAYHATLVPVGDDQRQHIELANDIAEKFNHDYGVNFFPRIEVQIPPEAARIMSLRDATKKMSKSDPSDASRINLNDDADTIAQKIRRAKTDSEPLPETPQGLAGRPEAANLVGIYAALAEQPLAGVLAEFGGEGFAAFKERLAELLITHITPINEKAQALLAEPGHIEAILRNGAARAAALADPIVDEAERIVGFLGKQEVAFLKKSSAKNF